MALGMEVGLGTGDFVMDGDPATPSQFLAHDAWHGGEPWSRPRCASMRWMKTPLGTEVDLGPGHIVLDGAPALRERGIAIPPSFRPMSIVATVAHLSYC